MGVGVLFSKINETDVLIFNQTRAFKNHPTYQDDMPFYYNMDVQILKYATHNQKLLRKTFHALGNPPSQSSQGRL